MTAHVMWRVQTIVANIDSAIVQALTCSCYRPLALLKSSGARSVPRSLVFGRMQDSSYTSLEHFIARYLLRINVDRVVRRVRCLMGYFYSCSFW